MLINAAQCNSAVITCMLLSLILVHTAKNTLFYKYQTEADLMSVCFYLCQVKLSDFAAHVFSQAAGECDHAWQLTGVSSDQL